MPPENQQPPSDLEQSDSSVSEAGAVAEPAVSRWRKHLPNPYLLGVIGLFAIAAVVTYHTYQLRQNTVNIDGSQVDSSSLSQEDFARLAAEQAEIDSTNKTLNVAANSVFDGTMLVRSSLDVQGQLRVGQELNLTDLTVTGQGTVNNLDIARDLNVQGDTLLGGSAATQGGLSVGGGLSVSGSGTFSGNLTANNIEAGSLTFSGDLRMNGHIITLGQQTNASRGGATGNGGTVSVSGNDTAGTVNINTGSGTSSGILATIQFGRAFGSTPRVNITPVGAASGNLNWYITRNTSGFSIGTTSAPSPGSNFSFDYFIVE